MNRIITILVTIFILLLLYIWISHVWGTDNPRHPQQIVDATQSEHTLGADDPSTDVDTFLNTSPDPMGNGTATKSEVTSDNKTQEVTEPVKTEPVNTEPEKQEPKKPEAVKTETVKTQPVKKEAAPEKKPVVKTETKKAVATQTTPAPKATQAVAKKTSLPNTEGKHLVIAGNFLQMVNAEQRMAELKKAGFKDVEILNFDLSEYHTVCAGRFTDVNEARRLVKKLKDYHKIDAYVRVGN